MWQPVSDEYIRRVTAGEETSIEVIAQELGVPLDVGLLAASADSEQEAEAAEWVEAVAGDALS